MTASSSGNRRMVTGLLGETESLERAYQVCKELGYEIGEVNVVMAEETRTRLTAGDGGVATELTSKKAEGGELDGPTGGRVRIW